MANPLYGQNKADSALQSAPKIAISAQLDLTSTAAVYPVLEVPAGTYVHSIQILVTATITAGSMDIDIGDGDDADRFYDGWAAATGALALAIIVYPINLGLTTSEISCQSSLTFPASR